MADLRKAGAAAYRAGSAVVRGAKATGRGAKAAYGGVAKGAGAVKRDVGAYRESRKNSAEIRKYVVDAARMRAKKMGFNESETRAMLEAELRVAKKRTPVSEEAKRGGRYVKGAAAAGGLGVAGAATYGVTRRRKKA